MPRPPSIRALPLVAGLLALTAAARAAEQGYLVDEVDVIGCKTVSEERVRFLLSARAGKRYEMKDLGQAVQDDVHAIEKMGPFEQVDSKLIELPDRHVKVEYHFTEVPFVASVRYEGPNYFQRSGLDKVVATRPASYLNSHLLEFDRVALENHFRDDGYREVEVTVEHPVSDGVAHVVFHIDLGRKIEVGQVVYRGLPPHVHPSQLNPILVNEPGKPWQVEMMPTDQGALSNWLYDFGYLDVVVRPPTQEFYDYVRPEDARRRHGPRLAPEDWYADRVIIGYDVEPGELWHLGEVHFVNNTVASEEELIKAFGLPAGAQFKKADIKKATEQARRLISNQGYARADLHADPRYDRTRHVVDLTFQVVEGDIYTVDRIDIHGNYAVKDAVMRRAMRIYPGELWNDDKIDNSKRQILRTGLFKNEPQNPLRISPRFDDDQPGHVDLVVDVDEDRTGQISLQLGYSSASGVFGSIGYTEHNFDLLALATGQGFRGAGHILEVNAYVSQDRTSYGLSWTNPHLMDGPYSLSTSFYRSESSIQDWTEVRLTSSAAVSRNFLDDDLKIGVVYSYTDLKIRDVQDNAPNDALDGEGKHYLNTTGLNESYDQLDNPRLPTRGYRLTAYEGLTGEILPSSTDYFEYSVKGDLFVPMFTAELGGVAFLRLSERFKQLDAIGGTDRVPFYERYFDGGSYPNHRGFDQNRLSPSEPNRNGIIARTGGTIDSLATAEASFPVQGTNEGLRIVLFTDVGNVWSEQENVSIGSMRTAVGFGVRFPVQLPVALDFAWLLDPKKGDADSQIHFTLGFFAF